MIIATSSPRDLAAPPTRRHHMRQRAAVTAPGA